MPDAPRMKATRHWAVIDKRGKLLATSGFRSTLKVLWEPGPTKVAVRIVRVLITEVPRKAAPPAQGKGR